MKVNLLKNSKYILVAGTVAATVLFSGCGGNVSKTEEAMQMVQNLEYKEALSAFEAAESAGENGRLIARGKGIAYLGLADYENAIACLEAALQQSNGFVQSIDYDLNFYLATAYAKGEQLDEAEKIYDAILALKSDEEAYFLRGNVRLMQNNYEGAKEDFEKVIAMDSGNYSRLIEIFQALESYGYRELGKQYLSECLEKNGSKMSSYDSGRMYYYLGDYSQACMTLEKARDKGDANVYLYLGKAYEATGDYNYASSVYNSWIAKDTGSAQIYNQLGLCELSRGNYQMALDAFQAGMKVENNSLMQTLSFNEVVAYEYLRDYQKAAVLLDSYLKSYPDDEVAKREQIFLKTR